MTVSKAVERLLSRLNSRKGVRSHLVFWTVLVIVLAGTFVVSSIPLGLYTPTVGFQMSHHRRLPKDTPSPPPKSPLGPGIFRGLNQRVVAVGDLHGDLERLRSVLRSAEVLDEESDSWKEGCTDIVVQLGDVVDRGPDASAILDFLHRLKGEAAKAGGLVLTLNGNHELLTLAGTPRHVHPQLLEESGGPLGFRHLYSVGGRYGRILAEENYVAVLVSDVVYVHGGLTEEYAAKGLVSLNTEIWFEGVRDANLTRHAFHDRSSPLWDRSIVEAAMKGNCKPVQSALKALSAVEHTEVGAMVVGHTKMKDGRIGKWCKGRLITADVGMSRHVEGGGYEAFVTVDPYTASWKRQKVSTASRISFGYPLGAGVRVALNMTAAVENDAAA